MDDALRERLDACREILRNLGKVAVAFSGGVDSSVLLAIAAETIGRDKVLAATAVAPVFSRRQQKSACRIARPIGVRLVEFETRQLDDADFTANPPDRCYRCKQMMLGQLKRIAGENGFSTVITGTNADDEGQYRPGRRAERELGVRCPLAEAGLTKVDIRAIAAALNLPNCREPSDACLATRIPYGREITVEKLARIEKAEEALHALGFAQCRLRDHDPIARIEVPTDLIEKAVAMSGSIVEAVKTLGYIYVTLDLEGFRSGSMDEGF